MAKSLYDVAIVQTCENTSKTIYFYNLKKAKIKFNPKTKSLKFSGIGKNGNVFKNEYANIIRVEKTKSK